jgi:hypothetical protein
LRSAACPAVALRESSNRGMSCFMMACTHFNSSQSAAMC